MTRRSGPILAAGSALFGPIVWATHFLVVYASESLLCRLADGRAHTLLLAVATGLALLSVLGHGVWQWHSLQAGATRQFLARTGMKLDGLALVAITLVVFAGVVLPACR